MHNPVFLVGTLRSGTTLLTLMLDHHPELAWCHEFEYALHPLKSSEECPDVDTYSDWLESDMLFSLESFQIDRSLGYVDLVNSFLEQKRTRDQKRIVGATVHHHIDKILYVWPDAKFIHIVRDPRDVAYSCVRKQWCGNFWTAPEWWLQAENTWNALNKRLPENRKLHVQYESLVENFSETLETICNFIGVAYDSKMLDYINSTPYSLPDKDELKKWKGLEDSQVQLVEARVGDLLTERGYQASGVKRIKVGRIQKALYRWHDRYKRREFKVRRATSRYGLPLISKYYMYKLFNREELGVIKRRMNEIDSQFLKWNDRLYQKKS